MPRVTYRLSAIKVDNLKTKGLHPDGDGLYLRVTETGTKGWIYRYSDQGRLRDMGLVPLAQVSLAKARILAAECRRQRRDGHDPIQARVVERRAKQSAQARATTFKDSAEQLIASHEAGWRNAKHRRQWGQTLKVYAYPLIGDRPVGDIDTNAILQVLQQPIETGPGKTARLWDVRTDTASRVRGRIEAVLSWAKARGMRDGANPAQWRGHMDQLLPALRKVKRVRHFPALPYAELPAFMADLRACGRLAARALEFVILTASRTGEALGARFDEIDIAAKVWTVPADRMKAQREHRVPLSARAVAIVKEMAEIRINNLVFPGLKPGRRLDTTTLWILIRDLRPGNSTHGFRSTFKDWAAEQTNFPDHLSEAALAHISSDKVRAAYARSDLFDKRRHLMDAWAEFCTRVETGKVVRLKRQGG